MKGHIPAFEHSSERKRLKGVGWGVTGMSQTGFKQVAEFTERAYGRYDRKGVFYCCN